MAGVPFRTDMQSACVPQALSPTDDVKPAQRRLQAHLINAPDVVAKNEDEGQQTRRERHPCFGNIHLDGTLA